MGGMDFFFLEAHALIRDHPCLRGEYFTGWLVLKYPTGSLPLTRGILFDTFLTCCLSRDHPRLRGEYWSASER